MQESHRKEPSSLPKHLVARKLTLVLGGVAQERGGFWELNFSTLLSQGLIPLTWLQTYLRDSLPELIFQHGHLFLHPQIAPCIWKPPGGSMLDAAAVYQNTLSPAFSTERPNHLQGAWVPRVSPTLGVCGGWLINANCQLMWPRITWDKLVGTPVRQFLS